MSENSWYIRQVSPNLYVELFSGDDPHLTVNREGAGLVRVELAEARALAEELIRGAALLAARQAKGYDDSPVAGDPDVSGKPDDFYGRGEPHPDVW